jgi:hypothetical protein
MGDENDDDLTRWLPATGSGWRGRDGLVGGAGARRGWLRSRVGKKYSFWAKSILLSNRILIQILKIFMGPLGPLILLSHHQYLQRLQTSQPILTSSNASDIQASQ